MCVYISHMHTYIVPTYGGGESLWSIEPMESMEYWSIGVLEYWSMGHGVRSAGHGTSK